jgi:hypothetical protein
LRVVLTERHLRVLVRATREALASDLLLAGEFGDGFDVLELLDRSSPRPRTVIRPAG